MSNCVPYIGVPLLFLLFLCCRLLKEDLIGYNILGLELLIVHRPIFINKILIWLLQGITSDFISTSPNNKYEYLANKMGQRI